MPGNYRIPSDYQNEVSRSVHRWSSPVYGTFHPGLAYPIKWRHLDVGDRVRCRPQFLVQSQPMLGPLLQGFKLVTIATFTPDSVLYGWQSSGIRYTPQEYQKFSHFVFNPALGAPDGHLRGVHPEEYGIYSEPGLSGKSLHVLSMGLGLGEHGLAGLGLDSPIGTITDHNGNTTVVESNDYRHHIGRGGLWDWLGAPAGAVAPVVLDPNASPDSPEEGYYHPIPTSFDWRIEPFFAYFLSCYYYFANMQEQYMYFTPGAYTAIGDKQATFDETFYSFDPTVILKALAQLRIKSMDANYVRYFLSMVSDGDLLAAILQSGALAHGGLFSVPYSPDLFNNIIQMGQSPTVTIPVIQDPQTGDAVAVPTMRIKTKVQAMMDRLFVSGGRIGDVFRTLWGKKSSPYVDKPDFLGIWQSSINPSNVVATSSGSADGDSVSAGQMVARVDKWSDFSNRSGVDYTANAPGTLMFVTCLVPDSAYSQGLDPGLIGSSFADDFNPEMNGLGFVSAPRHRYSMLPSLDSFGSLDAYPTITPSYDNPVGANEDPNVFSVGDVVAWDYYKTDYPRLHGEFATNGVYQYWNLARRFTEFYYFRPLPVGGKPRDPELRAVDNFSTYINPLSWQYLFTGQSLFDPNFVLLSSLELNVVNKVSSSYMPYLGH